MTGNILRTTLLLAAVGLSASACGQSGGVSSPTNESAASPSESPAPIRKPPADRGTCPTSESCAPLTIRTSGDSNYYLVFRDSRTNRKAASIYMKKGETFRGGMPIGSYDLFYTAGGTWYGKDLFFGPGSAVTKADSTLKFSRTAGGLSGVELTLYPVVDGNLSTSEGELSDLN